MLKTGLVLLCHLAKDTSSLALYGRMCKRLTAKKTGIELLYYVNDKAVLKNENHALHELTLMPICHSTRMDEYLVAIEDDKASGEFFQEIIVGFSRV